MIENQIENPLLNQFVEDIKSKYPQYDIDKTDIKMMNIKMMTIKVRFNRKMPSLCCACKRTHDRAGAYIMQYLDGSLHFRCYRNSKESLEVLKEPVNLSYGRDKDKFDDIIDFEKVGGAKMFNSEAIGDDEIRDLYNGSTYATGKTQHIKIILNNLLRRKPKAVVFIISCRKTLSTQLTSDLNAISYDKIKGILDVSKNPVSVWQIDSIGRIPPGVIPDLIVIDEISQLTAHAWTGDNNKARFGMTT